MSDPWPAASDNSKRSFDVAIEAMRERLERSKVQIGPHTLYCEEAEFILPTLGKFDACVTDPPYGIGEAAGANESRNPVSGKSRLGTRCRVVEYEREDWDDEPVSPEIIAVLQGKTKFQIIFGGNYYDLPPTSCWLVWDKLNTGDFADCELAWTNLKKAVRRIQYRWNGMIRANNEPRGDHPTQKPIGVMKWCLQQLPPDVKTVIDPFAGSGTTGVACVRMGKIFTGIERKRKYFDIACRRISDAMKQPDLFIEQTREKPVQEALTFEVAS